MIKQITTLFFFTSLDRKKGRNCTKGPRGLVTWNSGQHRGATQAQTKRPGRLKTKAGERRTPKERPAISWTKQRIQVQGPHANSWQRSEAGLKTNSRLFLKRFKKAWRPEGQPGQTADDKLWGSKSDGNRTCCLSCGNRGGMGVTFIVGGCSDIPSR